MYSLAENKLAAFLGYVGVANRRTRFLVYSRGAPGGWAEDGYRQAWVTNLERRFPALKGRVFTMSVEGGVEKASFRDPQTVASVKGHVRSILGLGSSPAQTGK
jgi:hypothetical protein